jgi:hypothetical protein
VITLASAECKEAHRFLAGIGLYLRHNNIFRMAGGCEPLRPSEILAVQTLWDAEWGRLKPSVEASVWAENEALKRQRLSPLIEKKTPITLPPPETPPPPEPIEGREYWERDAKKNGGGLAYAEKTNERAERLEQRLHAEKPKKAGPVPIAPRTRLIGIYLPDLYTKVFGGKYVPTRGSEIEFVKTCLALMGEKPANDESYIQDCFKLAGKRRREFCS